MKHSINKIFSNLSMFLIITTLAVGLVTVLILEQKNSYAKITNIKNQKNIVKYLINLSKDDIELALIQFNGKSTQLQHETDKLRNLNKYDYMGMYVLKNSDEYLADLDTLSKLTNRFNASAHKYYIKNLEQKEKKNKELKNSFYAVNSFLDSLLLKNIDYNERKFQILEKIAIFAFIITLFTTYWYRKRLDAINKDILHLYAIDKSKGEYQVFSTEVDAIKLRMNRKPVVSDNPAMLDPVTQINNYKGMQSSYGEKKGMKDSNFTSVTIFELDNFSKQNRVFSQEFTQAILKKVAFTMSLHQQATDVIARIDYNQFAIILSRESKDQTFKDTDVIRQSISEIKFKAPGGDAVTITASGGYVIKPNNTNLEEALRKAKEVLQHAKENGKNTISQLRDIAEHDL